ncbi:MAG: DUF1911 domain-containing protein [Gammaproteobacteria bacterium]|nr:DUF1911 domain-containing protein [Gammaproteobacteria bacterium]
MIELLKNSVLNRELTLFRDPHPDNRRYVRELEYIQLAIEPKDNLSFLRAADSEEQAAQNQSASGYFVKNVLASWAIMYSVGEPLGRLNAQMRGDLTILQSLMELKAIRWGVGTQQYEPRLFGMSIYQEFTAVSLWCMLEPDGARLGQLLEMHARHPTMRLPAVDFLLDTFLPKGIQRPLKYQKNPTYQGMWDALMEALASQRREAQTQDMTKYMANWNRLMKPLGWKPERVYCLLAEDGRQVDPNCQGDQLFQRFAFETALAVCAFDLDDSAFRDHLYYPRDLVDHYRANVRQQRDGWRVLGAPARFAAPLPPPRKKADLAKSKLKGYARWVELACDGDKDAQEAVIKSTGRLRSLKKEAGEALAALAENGQGVCADIKDDVTLALQVESLLEGRGLKGFDSSTVGGAGPARCEMLLKNAQDWLSKSKLSYRLYTLDLGDDAWYVLSVHDVFATEFLALGESLSLPYLLLLGWVQLPKT